MANNQRKLKKATATLNARIKAYEVARASNTKIGDMANKPGSMKVRP